MKIIKPDISTSSHEEMIYQASMLYSQYTNMVHLKNIVVRLIIIHLLQFCNMHMSAF